MKISEKNTKVFIGKYFFEKKYQNKSSLLDVIVVSQSANLIV